MDYEYTPPFGKLKRTARLVPEGSDWLGSGVPGHGVYGRIREVRDVLGGRGDGGWITDQRHYVKEWGVKHKAVKLCMLCMIAVFAGSCTVRNRVPALSKSEARRLLDDSMAFGQLARKNGNQVVARPELVAVEAVNKPDEDSMAHSAYATFRWRLVRVAGAPDCRDCAEHVSWAEFFFDGGRWNLGRIYGDGVPQGMVWEFHGR